jgi:hypothetical protein
MEVTRERNDAFLSKCADELQILLLDSMGVIDAVDRVVAVNDDDIVVVARVDELSAVKSSIRLRGELRACFHFGHG